LARLGIDPVAVQNATSAADGKEVVLSTNASRSENGVPPTVVNPFKRRRKIVTRLADTAKPVVEDLLQADESQLYEELGIRLQGIRRDPTKAGAFAPDVTYDAEDMGALDDVKAFGKKFFKRVQSQAYDLICGSEEAEERESMLEAFGAGEGAVAAAVASLLVAQLGLAPAIAAVVAALIIKLVFRSAYDAMCDVWKEKLPEEE
jgi:hypothetical protein